jgi:hypothetical protein
MPLGSRTARGSAEGSGMSDDLSRRMSERFSTRPTREQKALHLAPARLFFIDGG